MLVYVATTNQGKLLELRELTAGSDVHFIIDDLYEATPEGEHSYAENAASKARTLRKSLEDRGIRAAVVADDSGLEVNALGADGPVSLSGRYGGDLSWSDRRAALLKELDGVTDRAARFVCHLHYIDELGDEHVVNAEVNGELTLEERGERGFSYDPIFFYPPLERTFGELRVREKNGVSHRARAVAQLLAHIDDSEDQETGQRETVSSEAYS